MDKLMTWEFWQQAVRYMMAWGGTWFVATAADLQQLFMGAIAVGAGFIWWMWKQIDDA